MQEKYVSVIGWPIGLGRCLRWFGLFVAQGYATEADNPETGWVGRLQLTCSCRLASHGRLSNNTAPELAFISPVYFPFLSVAQRAPRVGLNNPRLCMSISQDDQAPSSIYLAA